MADLKLCPFCGSTAAPVVFDMADDEADPAPIRGLDVTVVCAIHADGCGGAAGYQRGEEDAIVAWNRRASGWVGVEERLPKYGEPVLVWQQGEHGSGGFHAAYRWNPHDGGGWCWLSTEPRPGIHSVGDITHWQAVSPPSPDEREERR